MSCCGAGWPPMAPMSWPPATTRGRGPRRPPGAAACRGCGQGPDLLPVGAGPGAAAPYPLPAGGADQAGGAADRRRAGPPTAAKPESQEICFVPAGDYRSCSRSGEATPASRGRSSTRTAAGSAPHRLRALHGRAAAWAGRGAGRGGLRPRGASRQQHGGDRSSDEVAASTFTVDGRRFVAGSRRPSDSAHRSASGIARRTCRPRSRCSATIGSRSRLPPRSGRRPRAGGGPV